MKFVASVFLLVVSSTSFAANQNQVGCISGFFVKNPTGERVLSLSQTLTDIPSDKSANSHEVLKTTDGYRLVAQVTKSKVTISAFKDGNLEALTATEMDINSSKARVRLIFPLPDNNTVIRAMCVTHVSELTELEGLFN